MGAQNTELPSGGACHVTGKCYACFDCPPHDNQHLEADSISVREWTRKSRFLQSSVAEDTENAERHLRGREVTGKERGIGQRVVYRLHRLGEDGREIDGLTSVRTERGACWVPSTQSASRRDEMEPR